MAPGSKIAKVARRYGVSQGLLWTWRRQAMNDLATEASPRFVPLCIEAEVAAPPIVASKPCAPPLGGDQVGGSIEIEIGRARVRVEGTVDPEALREVLGLIGPAR